MQIKIWQVVVLAAVLGGGGFFQVTAAEPTTDVTVAGKAYVCIGDCPDGITPGSSVSSSGGGGMSGSLSCWPTTGVISQMPFGSFSHGNQDAFDIGVGGQTGIPIYAPISGPITYRSSSSAGGTGCSATISITDGEHSGKQLLFAHMPWNVCDGTASNVNPKIGNIQAGALIGYVGTTGGSTGLHLHYEIQPRASESILRKYLSEKTGAAVTATCRK